MITKMKNEDSEWVSAIPEPVWGGFFRRRRCARCSSRFWTFTGYRGHYALFHILKIGARL